jgi:hypothetical protein
LTRTLRYPRESPVERAGESFIARTKSKYGMNVVGPPMIGEWKMEKDGKIVRVK